MSSFAAFGNALYSGERSVPVVPNRRIFYIGSLVLIAVAVLGLLIPKLNLGMEFTGGSEFRVSGAPNSVPAPYGSRPSVLTASRVMRRAARSPRPSGSAPSRCPQPLSAPPGVPP